MAAAERAARRTRVAEVLLHDDVAAEHDLPNGLPVARYVDELRVRVCVVGRRVDDARVRGGREALALARDELRALVQGQRGPRPLGVAPRRGPVGLCAGERARRKLRMKRDSPLCTSEEDRRRERRVA